MATGEIIEHLKQHSSLSELDDSVLQYLSECALKQSIKTGDVLFGNGDPADAFYLVLRGQILIEIPAISGPALEIQRLCDGKILGWSWLIPPYKWTFQARAEADTVVLKFDGAAVLARCEEDPVFGYAVLKKFSALMSERLEAARRRMMDEWNPPGFA